MTTTNRLAAAIRKAHRDSGWSILRLARESGVGYASAYGFLKRDAEITLTTAAKLCWTLGLALRPRRLRDE